MPRSKSLSSINLEDDEDTDDAMEFEMKESDRKNDEEFTLKPRQKTQQKLQLDESMLSLFFISQLNIDVDKNVPDWVTEISKVENMTNQEFFNAKYIQWTIFSQATQLFLLGAVGYGIYL